ncbi:MAG: IPT/TIG domain-containing protein, partial [Ignavibacteriales bacterium]|nr:IPT/TIG domain-containing protein [Ignavibacteriales bacterium]
MTQKMKSLSLVTFMCGLVLFLGSCKVEEPPVVYNPNDQGGGSPEITGVTPPNVAYAGVTEVKLTGKNFSSVDTLNSVYFDNKKANVLAASSTELTVLAPDLISDSAVIRVAVAGAFAIATYGPYKLAPVTTEYGGFFGLDEVYSIAMDSSENLYAQLKDSAKVFKVTPTGNKTLYGR